jgi:PAS domain S-box-containing protein
LILLSILFLLLCFQYVNVNAADSDTSTIRTIRVAMDNNYPPYTFLNADGIPQGILADQWRLWQKKTGIQVEIKAMDWKDALEGMRAGEFDVIDTAFKTEGRLGWLDFSKPYARIEVSAFFDNEISGITDVNSLKGFVVAVKEGDAAIDLLRSHGIDDLQFFKSYEAIAQAAKEHKVNVFVIDKPPALYFLHKYGIQKQYNVTQPFNFGEFHRAVKKGNTALLKEVESGFSRISHKELQQIEKKWHGAPILNFVSVKYLLVGTGIPCFLILSLFYWNRSLRKAVKKRTSELEASEEELRKSEARYRELVENANSIILRMDSKGRISFFNEFAQRFFGYESNEVIGINVVGTIVPETDSAGKNLQAMIADIGLRPNLYTTNENENMRRDGSRVWISWTNKPFYNTAGEVSEILCIGNDINDRKLAEEALQGERERLEFVIEGSRLATWEWNIQNNETVFDETWAQLIGYTLEELTPYNYETWERLVHPVDLVRARESLTNYFVGVTPDYDCEYRMKHKTGHWIWILDRGRVLTRDGKGKPLSMFGTHTDITKIKRVEEELQKTNELLSLFIKHSPIYAFIKEVNPTESRVLKVSDNFQDMIGIPASEMVGKNMLELFTAEFAAKITADDWLVASRREILHLDEDLNGRHYTTIKFPIQLGEKNLLAGYTIDITERKRTEEELRRRENQLQKIFEILPIGLWFADKNGTLQRGNPMGLKIWGAELNVPAQECGDFKAWRLPSREPVKPDDWALAKTIRHGVTIVDELLEIESYDGKRKTILNYSAPVLDDNGNVDGAIIVNLDISDRKALENQLLQSQKMESIGRLAGGVAHDFNNMLSVILGNTELALNTLAPDQPLFDRLHNIQNAAQRSADLTQQLLAFARRQAVTPKVLDLNETLEGILKILQQLIGENIDLAWLPGKDLGPVNMDPSQIDQILVNLCINARDAIGDAGRITIETGTAAFDETYCAQHVDFTEGEFVLLAVSDNGSGMDSETLSHLFEPFFTTKTMGEGTGLGLATVYGIVKQNHGFINVYSEPDQGTAFKIYLPLYETKADQTTKMETVEPAACAFETILLVEDEPLILDMATSMLESWGYTVLSSTSPAEAISLAREHAGKINLLITDVVMPEMNGQDLAKNLLSLYPDLKCLFMSGYTADVIAHHGVLDDGVQFIQKPFTMKDLASKIKNVLVEESADQVHGRGFINL